MPTDYSNRTRRIKGSTRLRPWTPADRRGWRTDPELTDTNE